MNKKDLEKEVNKIIEERRNRITNGLFGLMIIILSLCAGFSWTLIGVTFAPYFAESFTRLHHEWVIWVYCIGVLGAGILISVLGLTFAFQKLFKEKEVKNERRK